MGKVLEEVHVECLNYAKGLETYDAPSLRIMIRMVTQTIRLNHWHNTSTAKNGDKEKPKKRDSVSGEFKLKLRIPMLCATAAQGLLWNHLCKLQHRGIMLHQPLRENGLSINRLRSRMDSHKISNRKY
jgi:hypothetical protein